MTKIPKTPKPQLMCDHPAMVAHRKMAMKLAPPMAKPMPKTIPAKPMKTFK